MRPITSLPMRVGLIHVGAQDSPAGALHLDKGDRYSRRVH